MKKKEYYEDSASMRHIVKPCKELLCVCGFFFIFYVISYFIFMWLCVLITVDFRGGWTRETIVFHLDVKKIVVENR